MAESSLAERCIAEVCMNERFSAFQAFQASTPCREEFEMLWVGHSPGLVV